MRRLRLMRRSSLLFCALLLGVLAAVSVSGAGSAGRASTVKSQLQINRALAQRDARTLLAGLRLPGGVTRIATLPRFARSFADFGPVNGRYYAGEVSIWTTTLSARTVINYARTHKPVGASTLGTGSGGDVRTGTTSLEVTLNWASTANLYNRRLDVTVVTPSHGPSVIVAQSQSYWIIPRPHSELVPAGITTVQAVLRIGGGVRGTLHMHTSRYTLSKPALVKAVVNRFNSLPTVQPGDTLACPLMLRGAWLQLRFMAGVRGPTLASAEVTVHPGAGWDDGSNSCGPISFTIGGRQQTPLTGPHFVRWIGTLIGRNIS